MNLLSSFIVNNIIKALEAQLLSHLPELQQEFLNEVSSLVNVISNWVESKMSTNQGASENEKKGN